MFYFRENTQFIFNLNHNFTLILNFILGHGKIIGSRYNLFPKVN